jgi:hypothetical protein
MKRLITSAVAAIALLTVGTTMLWSRAPAAERHLGNIGMPSLQELYTKAGVNTLPNQGFEDRSVEFGSFTKG